MTAARHRKRTAHPKPTPRDAIRPGLGQALDALSEGETLVVPNSTGSLALSPMRAIGTRHQTLSGQAYDLADLMGKMFFHHPGERSPQKPKTELFNKQRAELRRMRATGDCTITDQWCATEA